MTNSVDCREGGGYNMTNSVDCREGGGVQHDKLCRL